MGVPYFGGKGRLARLYPPPVHDLVIEPFAGMIGYSWYWRPTEVTALEADDRVVALWRRLSEMTEVPPVPEVGTVTTDLLAMLLTYSEHSLTSDYLTVTSRMVRDWTAVHARIIRERAWMRSVGYSHRDYRNAPDVAATWFIDPPYQYANRRGYRFGASRIDYGELREWCLSRRGQVIVCEQAGADWLPFAPLADITTHRGAVSRELWWTRGGAYTAEYENAGPVRSSVQAPAAPGAGVGDPLAQAPRGPGDT